MKIKADFVTNSSSTSFVTNSFVMCGFSIPYNDTEDELRDVIEKITGKTLSEDDYVWDELYDLEGDIRICVGTDGGAKSDDLILIGRDIATFFDYYCDYKELNVKDNTDVIKVAKKFGLGEEDVKIILGRRYS